MKQKIQILPENLCNKIAAGEVVERPSSVVKELLENSIDAGAGEIRLEVEKGGKRLIRVIDDGEGMSRDDAFLCLERHGTSKIRSDDDLFALQTLGFRGEALPSIASVSRLTLRTCTEGSMEGWEVYVEGGVVKRTGAVGLPRGTSIEVRDLFFNTPGRRKFLRRDETEFGHIADVVSKLALAHPEIQFRLFHNGKSVIEVHRQTELSDRVAALLGRALLRDLVSLDVEGPGGLALKGLISQPAANRSTSSSVYCFINGRYIRDRVVQHAIMEGYRNLLFKGRYPVVVLFLSVDPAQVDVNVHPTKHEVRFREQRTVHDFIAATVREALRPSGWLAGDETPSPVSASAPPAPGNPAPAPSSVQASAAPALAPSSVPASPAPLRPDPAPVAERGKESVMEALLDYSPVAAASRPMADPGPKKEGPFALPAAPPREEGGEDAPGFFSCLELIGQYRRSYLLCQDGDDLLLIDQHAAHERIGFERLKKQFEKGEVERQGLLFPVILDFDFREVAPFESSLGDLARLGFDIEPFGGKSFALKAVPRLLGDAEAERLLRDVAGELATLGKSGLVEEALDNVLILMACHSVIRANQFLCEAEIRALLADLDAVDFSAHCPHGRPVMVRLPVGDVERMFKRT